MPGWEGTPPGTGLGEHVQGVISDARSYAVKQDEIGLRRQELERQSQQIAMTRMQHQIEMGQKVMDDWKNVAENALSPQIQKAYIQKLKVGYQQMGWQWDPVLEAAMKDDAGRDQFIKAYTNIQGASPDDKAQIMVNGSRYMKEGQLWEGLKAINTWGDEQAKIKATGDQNVRVERVKGEEARKTEGMKEEFAAKKEPLFPKLTPGEEETDKEFAKNTYQPFVASGGVASLQKDLSQLRRVSDLLGDKGSGITGFWAGNLPDVAGAFTNPTAVDSRQIVEQVVTKSLKSVFGSQFTEKEGERFMARAYNARLSPEVNQRRLQSAIQELESAASSKIAAAQYYEAKGTLRGFKGTIVNSVSDLLAAPQMGPAAGKPSASKPPPPQYAPELIGMLKKMKALKLTKEQAESRIGQPIPPDLAKQVGY